MTDTLTPKSTVATVPGRSPDRLVLNVGEAAELLGISRAFAYELVARGELPSLHLGRRIVVPKVALMKLFSPDEASLDA